MPPLVVVAIIAGGAAITSSYIMAKSSESASRARSTVSQKIAGKRLAAETIEANVYKQEESRASKTAFELSEKKILLDSQRFQIDTLANMIQTDRMARSQISAPQYFQAPQRPAVGFAENINSQIHKFFGF